MKIIKKFILFLESISFINKMNDWNIDYNQNTGHDLNVKIKRTDLTDSEFDIFLNDVISKCEEEKLIGDIVFVSFKYKCKIVTNVKYKNLYVITFLGKDENIKNNNIIKII